MGNYVTLLGAEEVGKAGWAMKEAAEKMARAASEITEAVTRLERALEDDRIARLGIKDD